MTKVQALEEVVEGLQLTEEDRWQFAQWLQRDRVKEWNRLFAAIDCRRKGRRFTMPEIVREIKAYRFPA